jgi:hypothetical protein
MRYKFIVYVNNMIYLPKNILDSSLYHMSILSFIYQKKIQLDTSLYHMSIENIIYQKNLHGINV